MANAANSTELRTRIQNASALDPIINLTAATTYSVTTLGKFTSLNPPAAPFSGYIIQSSVALTPPGGGGASASNLLTRKFSNTRIYQQNIDGPYSPGLIKDVELTYTTGSDALLSATTGNFSLSNVRFSGTHSGWAGNGNKYLSLTSFNPAAPLSVPLSLTNVSVTISGQAGFNGTTGGSAFLHSWNNNGPVLITNSIFDESGFASTLNLLGTGPSPSGTYTITNNIFNRSTTSANRTVRPEGNRLENVNAVLSRNTFTQGSYLDLYGNISGITLGATSTTNTFNTISSGYGIRVTAPNTGAAPTLLGTNAFTGSGVPLKYVNATPNTGYALTGGTITVGATTFNSLIAGGQAGDSISGTANADWINGDDGNDNISGGAGDDSILGGNGNDTIEGGAGIDILNGGVGIDTVSYASSSAAVTVNLSNNTTGGDAAGDSIALFENLAGGSNADTLTGSNADNTISGNSGDDTIDGLLGNDSLLGGAGLDSIIGGGGNDTLDGGDGNDNLNGGDGADHLYGDLGNDILTGGLANDRFYFNTALNASTNLDIITDFSNTGANTDKIYLNSSIFTGLPLGTLSATDFGTAPALGADVVASGGALYFAAGGAATLAGYTQFATINNLPLPTISRTDFVVY